MNLDALVAPLRADVVSGAAVVGRTAAEVMRRAAVRVPADSAGQFRETMGELSMRIMDAQPAMAPLVCLARLVLDAIEGVDSLEEARRLAARTAEEFRSEIEERTLRVGRRADRHIPSAGTVVTLSSSSAVRAALVGRGGDSDLRVVCLESRPMNEGQIMAEALARAGVRVTYAVDAAAGSLMELADLVLLGADSIGDAGIVNKIGSTLLAREAGRRDVPVIVTADRTKLLPPGFPQPVADDRAPDEVWRAPSGVRIWNRYFEVVPIDAVSLIVTDEGDLSPSEAVEVREALAVPAELRAWADSHSG